MKKCNCYVNSFMYQGCSEGGVNAVVCKNNNNTRASITTSSAKCKIIKQNHNEM